MLSGTSSGTQPQDNLHFLTLPSMFKIPTVALCNDKSFFGMGSNIIVQSDEKYSLKYLAGILNSKFASWWFKTNGKQRGSGLDIGVDKLRSFPVRHAVGDEVRQIEHIVDKIIEKSDSTHARVSSLKNELDQLIYRLYNLSSDEIETIETVCSS